VYSVGLIDYFSDASVRKLIHRTEDDLHRLFAASAFGRPCTRIRFEAEGVNMFAECVKA
jgi:hypothetical protein